MFGDLSSARYYTKSDRCTDTKPSVWLCMCILKITDNLSKTFQKDSFSAAEAQNISKLTVATLKKMRIDEDFLLF